MPMSDGDSSAVFHLPADLFGGDDALQAAQYTPSVGQRFFSRSPTTSGTLLRPSHVVTLCKDALPRRYGIRKLKGFPQEADEPGFTMEHFDPPTAPSIRQSPQKPTSSPHLSPVHKSYGGQSSSSRSCELDYLLEFAHKCGDSVDISNCENTCQGLTDFTTTSSYDYNRASLVSQKTHSTLCSSLSITFDDQSEVRQTLPSPPRTGSSVSTAPRTACASVDDAEKPSNENTTSPALFQQEHARWRDLVAASAEANMNEKPELESGGDLQPANVTVSGLCGSSTAGISAAGQAVLKASGNLQLKTRDHNDAFPASGVTAGMTFGRSEYSRIHDTYTGRSGTATALPTEYQLFLKETQELITHMQRGGLGSTLFPFPKDATEDSGICSLTRRRVVVHEEDWGTRCVNDVMPSYFDGTFSNVKISQHVQPSTIKDDDVPVQHSCNQERGDLHDGNACKRQATNAWALFLNAASQEHLREGLRPLSSIEWSAAVAIALHIYSKKLRQVPHQPRRTQVGGEAEAVRDDLSLYYRRNDFIWTPSNNEQLSCGAGAVFSSSSPIVSSQLTRQNFINL